MQDNAYYIYAMDEMIEDQSFINWTLGRATSDEIRYWTTYENEHPQEQSTIHQAREAVKLIVRSDRTVSPDVLLNIRARITEKIETPKVVPFYQNKTRIAMAAVLIGILAVFSYLFSAGPTTVSTAHGDIRTINLPDGSEVLLNAGSRLSYEISSYKKSDRILHLDGHAFFKVVKGKPFIVRTDQGDVTVLGTSFDVYQRDDAFIVACKTGSVQVSSESQQSVILSPGEEVRMSNTKTNKIKKGLDKIGCWGKGTFYYEAVNLRRILDEVERQFDTKIVCQPAGLGDQMYSGYFINTHLDSALMSICWPLRIQYEHQDHNIIVSRK
jgi:ferric-dicitrate binding protein FerR (iron transport regulator)